MGVCAKQVVVCILRIGRYEFVGRNDCNNPQKVCPRQPGEGYEKCKSVCDQQGHAEIQALRRAQNQLGAQCMPEPTKGTAPHRADLYGHTYYCQDCSDALHGAGIHELNVH